MRKVQWADVGSGRDRPVVVVVAVVVVVVVEVEEEFDVTCDRGWKGVTSNSMENELMRMTIDINQLQ